MSAYIVDPETVNRIVSFIEDLTVSNPYVGIRVKYLMHDLVREMGVVGWGDSFFAELAHEMMALNVEAVKQRYPDHPDHDLPGPIGFRLDKYRYQPVHWGRNLVQVYKSLQCWLYQCAEGNVPEKPLFKIMARLKSEIAEEIVCNLTEYQKAAWS